MKKALIFDPYIDTLGGGERYALTLASVLDNFGFETNLAWSSSDSLNQAQERFGLDLKNIKLSPEGFRHFSSGGNLIDRFVYTRQFDLIFFVSDGSLPFLFAKKNWIHFQVPFTQIGGNSLINRIKLTLTDRLIYNSEFTKNVIERNLPASKGEVLYPPIDVDNFSPSTTKESMILSVGRFDSPSHSKRQDVLIEAFKLFPKVIRKEYRLILAGGLRGDESTIQSLKQKAQGLNVDFAINPKFEKLKDLYKRARYFWHAAGYEVDEVKNPEKVEHFGMATVEAMAAGCIPIVINKGGQPEVITPNTGYLCNSPQEMAARTTELIQTNADQIKTDALLKRANIFSVDSFSKKVSQLLQA